MAWVHRLVLEAFVGPCPEGLETRHLDGNPSNNRLENLVWDTHANNMADGIRHGTRPRGESHWQSKLTDRKVRQVRRLAAMGQGYTEIGRRFGVNEHTIRSVIEHKTWTHVV
jgi:hypothetical protein